MHRQVRGFCIIINNQVFADPELTFRRGSRADAYRLSDVFSQLSFDVHMYDNQTSDQMTELLMRFRDREADLSAHDALAVIIMSHGCKDGVYGSDGQVVPVNSILRYFNNDNYEMDQGVCIDPDLSPQIQHRNRKKSLFPKDIMSIIIIPKWSDIFVYYSTIEGYLSPRNTITGSWFGYGLAHCLAQYSATEHLNDLVTIRLAKKVDHRISRLKGTLVFKSAIECKTLGYAKKRNLRETEDELLVIIAYMESMDWKGINKFGHTMETSGLLSHELCEHYSTTQWMTRLRDLVFTGREFTSKLTLRKARKIKSTKRGDVYPMHRKERGFCIIINNQWFADPELTFRSGSQADAHRLSDVFSELGFDVQMFANRTSDEMKKLFKGFRNREADLSAHDALAVIILSHGCEDGVYGTDGQ
ncbi:unnamed protein product, partial [Oppiella nova]